MVSLTGFATLISKRSPPGTDALRQSCGIRLLRFHEYSNDTVIARDVSTTTGLRRPPHQPRARMRFHRPPAVWLGPRSAAHSPPMGHCRHHSWRSCAPMCAALRAKSRLREVGQLAARSAAKSPYRWMRLESHGARWSRSGRPFGLWAGPQGADHHLRLFVAFGCLVNSRQQHFRLAYDESAL